MKTAAEQLSLSLEMLFRAADVKCEGSIPLDSFKIFLTNLKLKAPMSTITRFLFLVDEDCKGSLIREDYYTTLAAYGVNTEREWAGDTLRTFEQQ